jgi:hypothetical protein
LPFHPIVSFPNLPALGLGVLSYFVLGTIVGSLLLHHLPHGVGSVALSILLIAPGFVLGITAKRSPLMHGILLGLLIVGFMVILDLTLGATLKALHDFGPIAMVSVIVLMIACSFGAVLGDFVGDKLRGL